MYTPCVRCHRTQLYGHRDPTNHGWWYCEECWLQSCGYSRVCNSCLHRHDHGRVDFADQFWYCNRCRPVEPPRYAPVQYSARPDYLCHPPPAQSFAGKSSQSAAPMPAKKQKKVAEPTPKKVVLDEDIKDISGLRVGPQESAGSAEHAGGTCKPCAWHWKPSGCFKGNACTHCHLCANGEAKKRSHPRRSRRARARLKKQQLEGETQNAAQTQIADDEQSEDEEQSSDDDDQSEE
eukprot:TRINITY_DN64220_c0_g1_i1.p1 TRINITY_DN64220_c0_g1~~TRINITY_DN64220_c0_g1_i1.p1  ORF type:complete len:235 (+),score=22.74 TRINITY_DN64220_c0_g1_i1:33-737(+)